jgi:hypothetical protein
MSGEYSWRSNEECFSLDIPLYRTSGPELFLVCPSLGMIARTE